jgi:hypothetical protein
MVTWLSESVSDVTPREGPLCDASMGQVTHDLITYYQELGDTLRRLSKRFPAMLIDVVAMSEIQRSVKPSARIPPRILPLSLERPASTSSGRRSPCFITRSTSFHLPAGCHGAGEQARDREKIAQYAVGLRRCSVVTASSTRYAQP